VYIFAEIENGAITVYNRLFLFVCQLPTAW